MPEPQTALVFGARNLGRGILELLAARGWNIAGVARSEATLDGVRALGGLALEGDITNPASIGDALRRVAETHGRVDLVVNAASPYGGSRSGPFGGGPITDAGPTAFDDWATAPARAAFTFLSETARFARRQGLPATLIQVTGGSARRAMPGRGLWAAGMFGVRALTLAAAQELRGEGIHVALLMVDAGIEPYAGPRDTADPPTTADPPSLAQAVLFLAEQGPRAATHELQVTPLGERYVM